ncbi:MAG: hypothetical protein M1828_001741 [Chrysothrix sp. TS-e1954]|nr:MAG: hypothetical protein M1828_001741 [Chrysothrix sp. TS-e1954]
MAPLKAGDKFPTGIKFEWTPITNDDPTSCGMPQEYDASQQWQGKKVVLVSVPGAFTPGCQGFHLPPFIQNLQQLKSKGVDIIAVVAFNDSWVMNAWGKVNKVSTDDMLFMGDTKSFFSKNHGWSGLGERNGRWAMIIERDGTVSYSEVEPNPREVKVSGAHAILEQL